MEKLTLKQRLALWLIEVAKWLYPKAPVENFEPVENYKPMKLGLKFVFGKKDIREFSKKDGARMSWREAKRNLINDARKKIKKNIIESIDYYRLIEFDVRQYNGELSISGCLKVYVEKLEYGKSDEFKEQQATETKD